MSKELPKTYNAQNYEDKIYQYWQDSGFFNPDVCQEKSLVRTNDYFSMVLPPPNVTGTLHMGHAAMLAIQDLLIRYHRLKGDKTLWLPGTDHAAIATQTKVEKNLIAEGYKDPRQELGREKFLQAVNDFAQKSHDIIVNQSKKMGSSLDWSREAFTLDEKRSLAVRTAFKKMYDDGLIEKGHRIVNWCPRCLSTLADDEVEHKEQQAKLYTFKYSVDFPIPISTTRPETKLGDTAVAVNPQDERYKQFIGQEYKIKNFAGGPDLKIKIIADDNVDMGFGTGAVGVTPAHSFVDYEMYKKHNLNFVSVIDKYGQMTKEAGEEYQGLSVKQARQKIIDYLQEHNLLIKVEDIKNNLSICYRCGEAIEPLISDQWFVKVNKKFVLGKNNLNIDPEAELTLKDLMIKVVKDGQIKIIPERFEKIYYHWIENLRDWCISRQIWYGHRIPVWYKKGTNKQEIYVDIQEPTDKENWEQDPDTLDTWFSSGLWTFSTLGWPNKDSLDLKNFHPTSVLETGYDILFFWVARMILMTTYNLGEIPFKTVYLHGLVRDEKGRKMSKSLGNVIDPLVMIEKYGADATRLSLLIGNTPGNDIKLSEEKVAGFRNFVNKLWNISRYILNQLKDKELNIELKFDDLEIKTLADKWIINRLQFVGQEINQNLDKYYFSIAGEKLREFTWNELADWYLEISKIEGNNSKILNFVLNIILKLWHPFMPFVTEAIWTEMYGWQTDKMLMVSQWPEINHNFIDKQILIDFNFIKELITAIRSIRAEYNIAPKEYLKIYFNTNESGLIKLVQDNLEIIKGLARLKEVNFEPISEDERKKYLSIVINQATVYLDVADLVNIDKEIKRLQTEKEQVEKYLKSLEAKLTNVNFVNKAPAEIVENEKHKQQQAQEKLFKITQQLKLFLKK